MTDRELLQSLASGMFVNDTTIGLLVPADDCEDIGPIIQEFTDDDIIPNVGMIIEKMGEPFELVSAICERLWTEGKIEILD